MIATLVQPHSDNNTYNFLPHLIAKHHIEIWHLNSNSKEYFLQYDH